MQKKILTAAFALVLFVAPQAHATETDNSVPTADVVETRIAGADAQESDELKLTKVEVQQRATADDAVVSQLPQRGSFWWIVGAIVVGGVILAVLL